MYIHLGQESTKVGYIRILLGMSPSRVFDNDTKNSVIAFQKRNKLVPDGIVGNKTWAKLVNNNASDKAKSVVMKIKPSVANGKPVHYADPDDIARVLVHKFANTSHNISYIVEGMEAINRHSITLDLDTGSKLAHFFGQMYQEVGRNMVMMENMNYTSQALKSIFKYYRINPSKADMHGRTHAHSANQEQIANHAYANRYGNGNPESGDGWNYRGRGGAHTTFVANYRASNDWIANNLSGKYPDFVKQPDLVKEPEYALLFGAVYWKMSGASKYGTSVTKSNSYSITNIYNRYTDSKLKRWKNTQTFSKLLGVT